MHVIATIGSDPDLARYYEIHWQIILEPGDGPGRPVSVARVMDIYRAGQAFTVLCLLLVASGVFALNRALFRGWPAIGLAALLLLYNHLFLIGLPLNYWFGVGLGLWAMAAWGRAA